MGISEAQQHFSAFGSGQLPEFELRSFIRKSLQQEPELSSAFVALTDAYCRAHLIDAKLQSTINADIVEVTRPAALKRPPPADDTGPMTLTMIRPRRGEPSNPQWLAESRAANSTNVDPAAGAGPSSTGSTGSSQWDITEGLSEVGTPLYPGAVIRDRFVLVEELGRGGMGVVYKAYDRSRGDLKDRYVAIKVLNEEFKRHPLAVKALQREARKAQKLAHPNVVAVHDFDRDGGNVYMVMEYLSGRSLDQVLREDGQRGIPLGPAMDIIRALAAALSYAHEQQIVHCDFKPSNAFLGRDNKVKVLDFGIARATPSLAEKGDITLFDAGQLGAISPTYASLEMLQQEQPDVRDDVYSFACVAYELLTGCHPYQRLDAVKAFQMGLQPRPISKLSRSQWRALKQGLSFRRSERCPSIDSLAHQLVSSPNNLKLWIGAAAGGVVALSLAGLLVVNWSTVQGTFGRNLHRPEPGAVPPGSVPPSSVPPSNGPSSNVPASSVPARPTPRTSPAESSAPAPSTEQTVAVDTTTRQSPTVGSSRPEDTRAALAAVLARPEATEQWATKLRTALDNRVAVASPNDPEIPEARQFGVRTFVTAAAQARSRHQLDQADALIAIAKSLNPQASEVLLESLALDRARTNGGDQQPKMDSGEQTASNSKPPAQPQPNQDKRATAAIEPLRVQFETQAAAGDTTGATNTAKLLSRAAPGTSYVVQEVPRILGLSYVKLAKSQFAGGKVNEALETLADGRKKFSKSTDVQELQVRYAAAAELYDRLSTAVVLNVSDMGRRLTELQTREGDEYNAAAQMLAQTLADRIADHKAANRDAVADKLLAAGKELFPTYTGILTRGRAGALSSGPIPLDNDVATEPAPANPITPQQQ